MPARKRKPAVGKKTTTRKVQATENLPPPVPNVTVTPEVDDDPWGSDGLTLKQRLFVRFYLGEAAGNATKAAQLAGYRDDNNIALRATAHENLTKPHIQRALEREMGKRFGSPEDVKASIAAIANGNAATYLEAGEDGKLHLSLEAMAQSGALGLLSQVQEERIEVGTQVQTVKLKLKLHDRLRALEILAKMNGQLVERKDITSNGETLKGYVTVSPDDWDTPADKPTATADADRDV